jgi:hypothetical protein
MGDLACVVLAHEDPAHIHRLVAALDPFPVFLHCDRRTPEPVYRAMVEGLPARCSLLPRVATGWARWENVEAELTGYRMALERTTASHIALMTGSDYPLASTADISAYLDERPGQSVTTHFRLPRPHHWGRSGGMARLRYRHLAFRKHKLVLPIPRRLPGDVVLAGGSQVKVLARQHAQTAVDIAARRPDLARFWRRSWIADETFVASVLNTPAFAPGWPGEHIEVDLWFINWASTTTKSPSWLTMADFPKLSAARANHTAPRLFARKFSTSTSEGLLDQIDQQLRAQPPRP